MYSHAEHGNEVSVQPFHPLHLLRRVPYALPRRAWERGQNPTARWVFFCFQGINVLLVDSHEKHIVGLQERQLTIISILGRPYQ
ncbi:MAG: hypothetical protein RM811_010925, partial [Endozoicomonas sp.]